MATSSIPVVTDAILAMLNAATWPGNRPQILDDITDEPNRESVIVGDTAGSSQRDWSTVGGGRIWEQYAIKLWIFAVTPGQTPKKARDRVY
jgi:hypothetical protein